MLGLIFGLSETVTYQVCSFQKGQTSFCIY